MTCCCAAPTLLVLDDVHWADEATLDLLRYLGRRMQTQPVLVAATYRSEEVTPGHPLSVTLGDLTTSEAVVRMTVPPLTPDGVRMLAEQSGSTLDADQLFDRTGGNAFYVTELVAFGESQLPPTVRDAVLARVSRLSAEGRGVLAGGAILGQPATLAMLTEVSGRAPSAVDECVSSGLLVGRRPDVGFRHALARLAVAESLLPSTAPSCTPRPCGRWRDGGRDDRRIRSMPPPAVTRRRTTTRPSRRRARGPSRGPSRVRGALPTCACAPTRPTIRGASSCARSSPTSAT